MQDFLNTVKDQVLHNQFLSGGFVLGAIGAVVAYFRRIPSRVYHFVRSRIIIELEVQNTDPAFKWLNLWLAAHNYSVKRNRRFSILTKRSEDRQQHAPDVYLTPAPGRHVMFYRRRLMYLWRERRADDKEGKGQNYEGTSTEKFTMHIFSLFNRELGRELIRDAFHFCHPASERQVRVYTPRWGDWHCSLTRPPRPLISVELAGNSKEVLMADIEEFLRGQEWYKRCCVPYRRGYLLFGPPGNGKSSIVFALASHFNLDIAMLSLSDSSMSDRALYTLMTTLPPHTILLIEDIDCAFISRTATVDNSGAANATTPEAKKDTVTLSGLLNALDGVMASEGRILFTTTNHPEVLDPALVRPGRIDVPVPINNASPDQAQRQFLRFFPESALSANFSAHIPDGKVSMAKLQGHLIKYRNDPQEAVAQAQEVLAA